MPLHTDCKNNTAKTIRLLKTARGQIEGIIKMIEEERDCIDISSQILATQSILKKVNVDILSNHLSGCIKDSIEHDSETVKREKLEEVVTLLNKMLK
ncbi:MAG: metal-sensing transcriptional repressor [Elusimicrobiaceae bacterium]|nr:metal-sensing transcriptional repressor [Elusimicrobiota bacterium]